MLKALMIAAAIVVTGNGMALAQENRIDLIRPDAPELAVQGELAVGVRTIELTNPGEIDILKVAAGKDLPTYDRPLTVEVWYPAVDGGAPTPYEGVYLRDGETQVTLHGRATRDVEPKPAAEGGAYPLVIISHGYPGNRFLLSHLAENLATKGYVVASIDHTDSTYIDQGAFGSTLVNRALDQKFVLNEMARLAEEDGGFLSGLLDAGNTAIIGYSMGGYGAVISAGGGLTQAAMEFSVEKTLAVHLAGSESYADLPDERVKAVIAIAPWGMNRDLWDAEGLKGIHKPIFYMAGSADDVSLYEDGTKKIYEMSVNAPERYLLTFADANHNAAGPIPAPVESWTVSEKLGRAPFDHYADAVWDSVRMNNIAQHFATAFLGKHLKGDASMSDYLDLVEDAAAGVYAMNEDGTEKPEHTYWNGFANRTAKGLTLMHATSQ
ncbi:putative dienelactone hydrolase [Devosia sp. LC5]|uniref:alpha/beta hydrolase family protein n=1 Tax=Devosia sp. LC5 TaxID=1502724 RepID=UPI0004E43E74|nr:dienelactone hydrolase [Devosia sp. LC5]KFC62085.1 putative dienelactone hydrolase [Devosia sp. LC5]